MEGSSIHPDGARRAGGARSKRWRPAIAALAASVAALALLAGVAGQANAAGMAFPGQNGKIVFQSDRDGDNEIYIMSRNGQGVKQLTHNTAIDSDPGFSPDGKRIVFASNRDGDFEIYTMNAADGSGVTRITDNPADDFDPAFAPDGQRVVFVSDRGFGDDDLYLFAGPSRAPVLLTPDQLDPSAPQDFEPAVSPVPRAGFDLRIAFTSTRFGGERIFALDVRGDGQKFVSLISNSDQDFDPSYSPRGSRIVFTSMRPNDRGLNNPSIFTMSESGAGPARLTNRPGQPPTGDDEPVFSPDGGFILFTSGRAAGGGFEIYRMNPDGSGLTRLTNNPADDQAPDWGPA
jgi:Tol biopolymer transport system component